MRVTAVAVPDADHAAAASLAISDSEFEQLRSLIYRRAGIHLSPNKRALVVARLGRRLRQLGLTSFAQYYRRVRADEDGEGQAMLNCITTNETWLFRDPSQFAWLEQEWLPDLADRRRRRGQMTFRAWSAGCSTGEEAYTLAMVLLDRFPPAGGWSVEVLATDVSTQVLSVAAAGIYPEDAAKRVPPRFRRFLQRGHGAMHGKVRIDPAVRAHVKLRRINLYAGALDLPRFDLILCRNVLIYFDRESQRRVVQRLLSRMATDGLIAVGSAENLRIHAPRLRTVGPMAYVRESHRAADLNNDKPGL